jgi:hypothetical protein
VELAVAACPNRPDHVDRLIERVDALSPAEPRSAQSCDRVPERAGAEAELDPPAAQDVETGDAPRQHHRGSQRQIRDVRRHPDVGRLRRDHRQQRPRVEEARLVRVILEGDQVEPDRIGEPG